MSKQELIALTSHLFQQIVPDIDPDYLLNHKAPQQYAKRLSKTEFLRIVEMKQAFEKDTQ